MHTYHYSMVPKEQMQMNENRCDGEKSSVFRVTVLTINKKIEINKVLVYTKKARKKSKILMQHTYHETRIKKYHSLNIFCNANIMTTANEYIARLVFFWRDIFHVFP